MTRNKTYKYYSIKKEIPVEDCLGFSFLIQYNNGNVSWPQATNHRFMILPRQSVYVAFDTFFAA